ncbi:MAG: tRNA pseudouridine(55) synthase TruB [Bacillota bacterium]|nr:tRNA pseudouridine(55) synthase TruB [Bacillota bacterium]
MLTEGVIELLKPAGMSSHDCVYFLRRLTGVKKIGHTGTLDPMAMGVLPLCIGNATRLIEYLGRERKRYRCEMLLGVETDTLDIWGQVLSDRRGQFPFPEPSRLREGLESFIGQQMQTPPGYSAIKVKGRKLYEYARKGRQIEAEARPVEIHELSLLRFDSETGRLLFDVECSRGTYVRSLCRDLGDFFGCGGTMSFLLRTVSGPFSIETAATLEELENQWKERLLPPDVLVRGLGRLVLKPERRAWFGNGGALREQDLLERQEASGPEASGETGKDLSSVYRVYEGDVFLGTARYDEEQRQFLADKVFCR